MRYSSEHLSFLLLHLSLVHPLEKLVIWEHQKAQTKKTPKESQLSLTNEPGRGSLERKCQAIAAVLQADVTGDPVTPPVLSSPPTKAKGKPELSPPLSGA